MLVFLSYVFILCVRGGCQYTCLCTKEVPGTHRHQQRVLVPLGLEFRTVVGDHAVLGTETVSSGREASVLNYH